MSPEQAAVELVVARAELAAASEARRAADARCEAAARRVGAALWEQKRADEARRGPAGCAASVVAGTLTP